MAVRKLALVDARMERSPGQDGDIFAGNVLDQRHGGPVTIGFGRYGPNQKLQETIAVHDTMIVLDGRLSVTTESGTVTAGPGEIVSMQPGDKVTITSHGEGATTAYVTDPHWQQAD